MLGAGVPLHFGGMADPFGRSPDRRSVTLRLLNALADHDQPTVISTKGLGAGVGPYADALRRGRFVVQFSFSTLDPLLSRQIEVGAPSPAERLAAMAALARDGVVVTARLQPLLPGRTSEASELIDAFAEHGATHVGIEHLKIPLEREFKGIDQLSRRLGRDVRAQYAASGATRVGREYVLPVAKRLPTILELRHFAHARGVQFGAADTDLLLLSDGGCCCSGTDLLGLENYHRYTYVEAVRRSPPDRVTFRALSNVWSPPGTISRFVNSRSRLPAKDGRGADMAAYIRENWNGRPNGPAPNMLWGVLPTDEFDSDGLRVYRLSAEARELTAHRRRAPDA
jgi:hypothetical protein